MNHNEILKLNKKNVTINVSAKGYGHTYFADRDFRKGELIMQCHGKIMDQQAGHTTIQIGHGYYFIPEKWMGEHLNHSCEPNTYINTVQNGFPALYAMNDIKEGDEITCHYAMTAFAWTRNSKENFIKCACGSECCKGKIQSFSQLSRREQEMLLHNKYCADYISNSVQRINDSHRIIDIRQVLAGKHVAA